MRWIGSSIYVDVLIGSVGAQTPETVKVKHLPCRDPQGQTAIYRGETLRKTVVFMTSTRILYNPPYTEPSLPCSRSDDVVPFRRAFRVFIFLLFPRVRRGLTASTNLRPTCLCLRSWGERSSRRGCSGCVSLMSGCTRARVVTCYWSLCAPAREEGDISHEVRIMERKQTPAHPSLPTVQIMQIQCYRG